MLTRAQAEAPPEVIELMALDQVEEMSEKLPSHVITSMKVLFDKLYAKITPQVEDNQHSAPASAPTSAPTSVRGSVTPLLTSARGSIRGSATPTSVLSRPASSRGSATPAPSAASVRADPIDPENIIAEPATRDPTPKLVEEAPVEEETVEEPMLDAAPLEEAIIESTPDELVKEASPARAASIEPAAEAKPVEVQAEPSPVREITPFQDASVQVVTETEAEPDKMDEDPVENHVEPQIQQDNSDDHDMEML